MVNFRHKPIEELSENMENQENSWWKPNIDKKILKNLTKRTDGPGWVNTLSYFFVLFFTAFLSIITWGTWWAIPSLLSYGIVTGFAAARWHEYGHRSVFKSRWLNDLFYEISSFICLFEPVTWRWSHTHHHSRTLHAPIDYEDAVPANSKLYNVFFLDLFGIRRFYYEWKKIILHALGIITKIAEDCVPESQRSRMIWTSRAFVLIALVSISLSIYLQSFLPILMIFTPNIYGWPGIHLCGLLQHGGLKKNSWDHRESTRTFLCGPTLGWLLYFNMQYHIEHHIFPQVPFYNLPKLHKLIKDQLPPPNSSFLNGIFEVVPAIIKQTRNPNYFLKKNF